MEKCLPSLRNRTQRWVGLLGFSSMGMLLIILAILALQEKPYDNFSVSMCIVLFVTGLAFCAFAIFYFIEQSREYSVDSQGITIRYLKYYEANYPWSRIGSISLCDINHAAKDWDVFDIAIRIVVGQEKNGPLSDNQGITLAGYDRWRSFGYGLLHFKKIIILDYSQERYNNIQKVSGKTIYDFRTVRVKQKMAGDGLREP